MSSGGSRATPGLLQGLALLSGFCALAYEVLYVRHITTLLGDALHVHAALLSTFLVGVGLGAWLAHRLHRWLFAMEMGSGAYALMLPLLTGWLSGRPWLAGVTGSPALSALTTMALVSVPGLLVGFSLPLLSAYVKAQRPESLTFQGIYGFYNAGAVLGVLAAELVLVRTVGIPGALGVVGGLNFGIGVMLWAVRAGRLPASTADPVRFGTRLVLALAAGSLVSAIFQMAFLQSTYLLVGPQRTNFALALAVILSGVALGAVLVARSGLRFEVVLRTLPLVVAGAFLLHPAVVDAYHATVALAGGNPWAKLALDAAIAFALGLPVMTLFGALVPALMRRERAVAEEAGFLLLVSGIANAAGYLLYVLVLHESLAAGRVLALGSAVLLVAASVGRRWSRAEVALGGAGLAALLALAFTWSEARFHLAGTPGVPGAGDRVTVFKSGAESATLVEGSGERWLSYNGHESIAISTLGVVNLAEMASGVIPALASPRLGRALVLGAGSGITAGSAAALFDQTDVVEINRAFLGLLPELADANQAVASNPAARIHVADGRAFLVGKEGVYDAIVSSVTVPTYYAAGKIYTLEFYRRVARALAPGGVFATWVSSSEMTEEGVEVVMATLARVFSHCGLWMLRRGYHLTVCGDRPLTPRRLSELDVSASLMRQLHRALPGLEPEEYFEDIRLADDVLSGVVADDRLNTDALPRLEFLAQYREFDRASPVDLFYSQSERYGVSRPARTEGMDVDRLARRIEIFRRQHRPFFERDLAPLLAGSRELREAWTRIRLRSP